jgi:uncharacterized protein
MIGTRFNLKDQKIILDVRKSLFWEEQGVLVISDLHLGKAGHFRKSGIPIPTEIHQHDLKVASSLIADYQPKTVLFLGDLFHSEHNEEWWQFAYWLEQHPTIEMILVKGNHDILNDDAYSNVPLKVVPEYLKPPFLFTHEHVESDIYNISGHIHPSVRLSGSARQNVQLPCFYFAQNDGIMPAFGTFTGNFVIKPKRGSRVFAIGDSKIIALVG